MRDVDIKQPANPYSPESPNRWHKRCCPLLGRKPVKKYLFILSPNPTLHFQDILVVVRCVTSIILRSSPSSPERAHFPSSMDCNIGKSDSSTHPLHYYRMNTLEHFTSQLDRLKTRKICHSHSHILLPLRENKVALKKQSSPISRDWREGRLHNSKE